MRIKKKILASAVMLLMVFSALFTVPDTFAYWSKVTLSDADTGLTSIGEWTQVFEWSSIITYDINETVTYNGVTYISLRVNNLNKIPGVSSSKNWWKAI
ncbi:MAG: hypothetical protein ABH890_01605 [Bacillota bacterium]